MSKYHIKCIWIQNDNLMFISCLLAGSTQRNMKSEIQRFRSFLLKWMLGWMAFWLNFSRLYYVYEFNKPDHIFLSSNTHGSKLNGNSRLFIADNTKSKVMKRICKSWRQNNCKTLCFCWFMGRNFGFIELLLKI